MQFEAKLHRGAGKPDVRIRVTVPPVPLQVLRLRRGIENHYKRYLGNWLRENSGWEVKVGMINSRNENTEMHDQYDWLVPVSSKECHLDCIVYAVVDAVHAVVGEEEAARVAQYSVVHTEAFNSMKRVGELSYSVGGRSASFQGEKVDLEVNDLCCSKDRAAGE